MSTLMNFEYLVKKEHINLSFNSLTDTNADVIAEVIEKSDALKELNLWGNRIALTDDKFSSALAKNSSLRVLSLGSNGIASEGMKRLADALKVNRTLQELYLGDNRMGNDGAKAFAVALAVNESLRMISFYGNSIGDEGGRALAESLVKNRGLRDIWLHENRMGEEAGSAIKDAVERNPFIEKCFVFGNLISKRLQNEIKVLLEDVGGRRHRAEELKRAEDEVSIAKADSARKDKLLAKKDEEIASLKAALLESQKKQASAPESSPLPERDEAKEEEIAALRAQLASKDEEIAALKTVLKAQIFKKDNEIAKRSVLDRPEVTPAEESTGTMKETVVSLKESGQTGFMAMKDERDDVLNLSIVASNE